jgi:hypothetical protein
MIGEKIVIEEESGLYTYPGIAHYTFRDICIDKCGADTIIFSETTLNEEERGYLVRHLRGDVTKEFFETKEFSEAENRYNELIEEIMC